MVERAVIADCTWCLYGLHRSIPSGWVVLFVCAHEHMTAYPMCANCAESAAGRYRLLPYVCPGCRVHGVNGIGYVDLVCTRAEWLERLSSGKVRFLREAASTR